MERILRKPYRHKMNIKNHKMGAFTIEKFFINVYVRESAYTR